MSERLDAFRPIMISPNTVDHDPFPAIVGTRHRRKRRRPVNALRLLVADTIAIAASAAMGRLILQVLSGDPVGTNVMGTTIVVVSFLVALAISGSYSGATSFRLVHGTRIWHGLLLGVVLSLLVAQSPVPLRPTALRLEEAALVALLAFAAIPPARRLIFLLLLPRGSKRRVLIVGSGRVAASVAARLHWCANVRVVGMVDDDPRDPSGVLGTEADLPRLCARYDIDDVMITFSRKPTLETLEILRDVSDRVTVWVVPRLYELMTWRSVIDELHGIPLVDLPRAQTGRAARVSKRLFDVAAASLLLVVLSPLFAAVAVAIKLGSPGPVLFRQWRSGQDRRPFRIYKFRTMRVDAEQQRAALARQNHVDGPIFKMKNDPRVTRIGQWLRQSSLDELPQLLNVVRGEMSLVGPRPFPIEESRKITGWATIRFSVPPGMTGLWQVSGRNALSYDDLRHLDYVYAASWSFLWDLRILLRTPASVLSQRGVV